MKTFKTGFLFGLGCLAAYDFYGTTLEMSENLVKRVRKRHPDEVGLAEKFLLFKP